MVPPTRWPTLIFGGTASLAALALLSLPRMAGALAGAANGATAGTGSAGPSVTLAFTLAGSLQMGWLSCLWHLRQAARPPASAGGAS